MKITISCSGGTKRTTSLAEGLYHKGNLDAFYIPYYAQKNAFVSKMLRKKRQNGLFINTDKVNTNMAIFLLHKAAHKLNFGNNLAHLYQFYFFSALFDRYVASKLRAGPDIIFVESVMALHTIRRAKELGIITILDRPNSHVQYQAELMENEYRSLGIRGTFNTRAAINKGIKEYQEADYIAVLSSFAKRTFIEKGIPEQKLLLIPSGINMKAFPETTKTDTTFRILFCGSVCFKKGVHYLLEAFRQLSLKNTELVLIGDIEENFEAYLKKYDGYYKHIGYIPHSEMYTYFSQGSIFVLPSLEEGLAKVIMEAMACGLPAIVTTNTGGEDIIRDGQDGFVIPIRDVEALKAKILFLYEDDERCKQMGRSAREHIRKHFSEDRYAERFIQACATIQKENSHE